MNNQNEETSHVPAISIIVAIYNAENYLNRLVESLINQTIKDIEILLINDGSTDNSGKLCDDYAAKDSRIKVFHRTNHGIAATRQFGLDHVTGTYVIHADSDDWLDLDMLEKMYEIAEKEKADMVICDYQMEYRDKTKYVPQRLFAHDSSKIVDEFYNVTGALWNKLIRTSCIKHYNIDFMKGIDFGKEDRFFLMRLVKNPLKIAYCPNVSYHYDKHSNGSCITGHISVQKVYNHVFFCQKMLELGFDGPFLCAQEIFTACLAIRLKAYSPEDFTRVFSHLRKTSIFGNQFAAFHLCLIVWVALHINYRFAEKLMDFKLWYRRNIRKVEA